MYFKIFSWSSALIVFTTFITKEDPLSVIKEPKESTLPSLNFTINATSSCIQVSNSNTSLTGPLTLFLSETPFEDFLISINNLDHSEKILIDPINSSKPSVFCNLQANSTYYLYYYQQDLQSAIFSQAIQTKPLEILSDKSTTNNNLIIALTISILIILFAFLRRRAHQKRLKTCCSSISKKFTQQHSPSPKLSSTTLDVKQLKKITKAKIQEFEERNLCGLCCDRPREVIFLECGHIYACGKCAKNLYQCPLDKKYITQKLHFRICDKFGINANYVNELEVNSIKAHNYDHLGLCYDKVKEYLNDTKKYELLKEKFDNYNYFEKCIKCNQQRKDTFFADCAHLVCCRSCSETISCCPIDRVNITNKVQVYYA